MACTDDDAVAVADHAASLNRDYIYTLCWFVIECKRQPTPSLRRRRLGYSSSGTMYVLHREWRMMAEGKIATAHLSCVATESEKSLASSR